MRITTLITFVLLARLLEPSQFGLVALASTFTGILTTIAEAGITTYIIQSPHLDDRRINSAFWTAVLISIVAAAALASASAPIGNLLNEPRVAPFLAVLSLTLVGTGVSSVPMGLLQRDMQFGRLAGRQLGGALASAVVGIVLALLGAGAWALVAQALTNVGVAAIVLWIRCDWRPSPNFSLAYALDSLRFGWKVLGINLLATFRDQGINLIIGTTIGPVALGYWSVATRILQTLIELGVTVVQTVAVPAFAQMRTDRERLIRAYTRATTVAAMLMLPLLVAASVLSPELVPLLFGQRWAVVGHIAEIQTLTGVFAMLVNFDQSVYLAVGRVNVELMLVFGIVLFQLVVVLAFSHFGLVPIAWALLGQSAVTWIIRVQLLRWVTGIEWKAYLGLIPPVLAGAASAVVMIILRDFVLENVRAAALGFGVIGLIVYGIVLWVLSTMFREEVSAVVARHGGGRKPNEE